MQGVAFEGNIVHGRPAGSQVVAAFSAEPRADVYAEPPVSVWQWPGGGLTNTKPRPSTATFLSNTVAPVAAAMRSAQQVCPCPCQCNMLDSDPELLYKFEKAPLNRAWLVSYQTGAECPTLVHVPSF